MKTAKQELKDFVKKHGLKATRQAMQEYVHDGDNDSPCPPHADCVEGNIWNELLCKCQADIGG